jgi:hypothetical protein
MPFLAFHVRIEFFVKLSKKKKPVKSRLIRSCRRGEVLLTICFNSIMFASKLDLFGWKVDLSLFGLIVGSFYSEEPAG